MAVNNLVVGAKVINHKGLKGEIEEVVSNGVTIALEGGEKKTVSKAIIARWWKDDESVAVENELAVSVENEIKEEDNKEEEIEAVVEEANTEEVTEQVEINVEEAEEIKEEEVVEEITEQVEEVAEDKEEKEEKPKRAKKEKPVKTEEELLAEKAEKERVKKEREEKRKAQYEENKTRMLNMRDWISSKLTEKYPDLVLKQNTTYVAVRYANRVTMEVHYRGENCNLYILPQGEGFVESELFNRKDGSKAWIVNQGYEVPVQQTDDIAEEVIRLFEASKSIVDAKEEAKRLETLRKKAEKQAKQEKLKEERNIKKIQAKKDKERLKAIMKAKQEEAEANNINVEEEVAVEVTDNLEPQVETTIVEEDEEIF